MTQSWHSKNEMVSTFSLWWSRSVTSRLRCSLLLLLPGIPSLHTLTQFSLCKEWPSLITSSSAHQSSLDSLVCCDKWLRCVLWAFPFVDKPFISVCVADVYSRRHLRGGKEMPAQMNFLLFPVPLGPGWGRRCPMAIWKLLGCFVLLPNKQMISEWLSCS